MRVLEKLVNSKDVLGTLDYLKKLGISNKRVSDLSGVNWSTVNKYKKGYFDLGEDKKDKILNTVKEMFL